MARDVASVNYQMDALQDLFKCADRKISYLSNSADGGDHLRGFGSMVRDIIWNKISMGNQTLCLSFAEMRLGRKVTNYDFTFLGDPKFILGSNESLQTLSYLVDLNPAEQTAIGRSLANFESTICR